MTNNFIICPLNYVASRAHFYQSTPDYTIFIYSNSLPCSLELLNC